MDVPYLSCNYPNRRRTSCNTKETTHCCSRTPIVLGQDFPCNPVPPDIQGRAWTPSKQHQHLRQYKQPHMTQGITHLAARTCLNTCVPCTIEFQSSRSLSTILLLRVSLSRLGGKHRHERPKPVQPLRHHVTIRLLAPESSPHLQIYCHAYPCLISNLTHTYQKIESVPHQTLI